MLNGIANFDAMHVQLWMATENVFVPCVIVQDNLAAKRIDMLGISQGFLPRHNVASQGQLQPPQRKAVSKGISEIASIREAGRSVCR